MTDKELSNLLRELNRRTLHLLLNRKEQRITISESVIDSQHAANSEK